MRSLMSLLVVGSLLASGCAPPIEKPTTERRYSSAVEQRRQLARRLQSSGDLAAAAAQWEVLTIIEPDDATFRQELASTRAAIAQSTAKYYQRGMEALKTGDSGEAARLMLRTLALDPTQDRAAETLRGIEEDKIGRIQSARASRVRRNEEYARTSENRHSYDLEQAIELFTAGDAEGGLRELQRYVGDNPGDKAGRKRIADVVFEQAQKLDVPVTRESAVVMYERALQFRGEAVPAWEAQMATSRKTLADELYEKGMRAYRSDLDLAIGYWDTCLKFNQKNASCALRLREAQSLRKQIKSTDGR